MAVLIAISGADAAREVVVRKNDTLSAIAARELGASDRWQEIARLNNISDPRRVREGQRLLVPTAPGEEKIVAPPMPPAVPVSPHLAGIPSVRSLGGANRFRSSEGAPWEELTVARQLTPTSWVMTSNVARADIAVGGDILEVDPYTILEIRDLSAPGMTPMLRGTVHVGGVRIKSKAGRYEIATERGTLMVEGAGTAGVAIDQEGRMHAMVYDGAASVMLATGVRTDIGPGQVYVVPRIGDPALQAMPSAVQLFEPRDELVVEQDITFRWSAVPGAKSYRFLLRPEESSKTGIEEIVTTNSVLVKKIPVGKYRWRVWPLGIDRPVPSREAMLTIGRGVPKLEVNATPLMGGANWRIEGTTAPNSVVRIGMQEITADQDGRFDFGLPLTRDFVIVGVEARSAPGGAPTRSAVALYRRIPSSEELVAGAELGEGMARIEGYELPARIPLADGLNRLDWSYSVGGEEMARGQAEIFLDRTPPEILSVTSRSEKVKPGDEVVLSVAARDKGAGLAGTGAAVLHVKGPGGWTEKVPAMEFSPAGEYVFRFRTPKNMEDGYIQVTRLEIADKEGNASILNSEGMVTETEDPQGKRKRFFVNLIWLGIGIAIGAAI